MSSASSASGPSGLERRYLRLLSWYPAEHRRRHEQEMLGVLMTDARPGQRRPGLAESANLIWGAVRLRLRSGLDSTADPGWRDTLAVLSVVMPLCFVFFYAGMDLALALLAPERAGLVLIDSAISLAGPLLLTVLVLLRLRRSAALAAAGMLIWVLGLTLTRSASGLGLAFALELAAFYGFILGLQIAALLASPGPRRGLSILKPRYRVLAAAATLAAGAVTELAMPHPALRFATIALIAVIAIGPAVASPLSRRVLVLLAIPFCSSTLPLVLPVRSFSSLAGAATYLPSAVISCLVIVAIRGSARSAPAVGHDS